MSLLPIALAGVGEPAEARITKIQINSRAVDFGGASFGAVGQYETLRGVAFGEVDPNDPLNEVITDIKLAPRNARGMVEYNMDFWINKPVDPTRANGTLLHDVPNRGNVRSLELNVGGAGDANAGDGFLQRQGFTMSDNGWEGDLSTGLQIRLPIARNRDGSEITNRIRTEYILNGAPASTQDLSTPPAYESVGTSNAGATLTRRVHQDDAREPISNSDWAFADCSTVPFPGAPSTKKICLKGNFDSNHIYELLYTAKNPMVLGLGFAATRDFISFLRNSNGASTGRCGRKDDDEDRGRGRDDDDDDGADEHGRRHVSCPAAGPMPDNPLGDSIRNAIIYGSSQSGRNIRTFIQLGFNQDENRNLAVEGAIPHKASNRGAFNVRFGQPDRLSGTQHTERQFPGAESSQTWGVSHDRISGVSAGQLDRCRKTHSCPKIFHTNTDTEYWQALMALNTTDSEGKRDLAIPKNVRIYLYAATRHGGGDVTKQPTTFPNAPGACQLLNNNNPFIHGQRALLVALREWLLDGTEPPPSLYPRLDAGTLVPLSAIRYPYLPAVNFTLSGVTTEKFFLDRGPKFNVEDISGVMVEPPIKRGAYSVRVPRVDADGNTIAGLPSTMVLVPVGTHLGWNVRKAGFSEGDSCDLNGAVIPFFRTFAERQAANDPRPSLQERYPTHADYLAKVTAAANGLFGARLLLREDADSLITQANATPVP
ncbi:MAG TPA: alpha/beta hydrolase domain-containing protein [Gemmatimonadales bacterium]|nr:alpha/beta hydrolase domain-containing protein [Gemmatimonadales bacterium]